MSRRPGRAAAAPSRRGARPPAGRAPPSARRGSGSAPRSASARAISTICRSPTRSVDDRASRSRATPIGSSTSARAGAPRASRRHRPRAGQPAEADVLGDRQRPGVLELLEDHPDAEPAGRRRGEGRVLLAVDRDRSVVGAVVTGEDLHERRLAGAVLTEQREHRAAGGVEVHPCRTSTPPNDLRMPHASSGTRPSRVRLDIRAQHFATWSGSTRSMLSLLMTTCGTEQVGGSLTVDQRDHARARRSRRSAPGSRRRRRSSSGCSGSRSARSGRHPGRRARCRRRGWRPSPRRRRRAACRR